MSFQSGFNNKKKFTIVNPQFTTTIKKRKIPPRAKQAAYRFLVCFCFFVKFVGIFSSSKARPQIEDNRDTLFFDNLGNESWNYKYIFLLIYWHASTEL